MLFRWMPIGALLVLPSAIAIRAIMAINGPDGICGNSYGTAYMATMGVQWGSIERLTQLCCFRLNVTIPSQVVAV